MSYLDALLKKTKSTHTVGTGSGSSAIQGDDKSYESKIHISDIGQKINISPEEEKELRAFIEGMSDDELAQFKKDVKPKKTSKQKVSEKHSRTQTIKASSQEAQLRKDYAAKIESEKKDVDAQEKLKRTHIRKEEIATQKAALAKRKKDEAAQKKRDKIKVVPNDYHIAVKEATMEKREWEAILSDSRKFPARVDLEEVAEANDKIQLIDMKMRQQLIELVEAAIDKHGIAPGIKYLVDSGISEKEIDSVLRR